MNAIFKKLNFKNQDVLYVLNAPDSFGKETHEMTSLAVIKTNFKGAKEISFLLAFVTKQKEVDDLAIKVNDCLAEEGLLWFAYPKGTSKKYVCEFNRDNGWAILGKLGFEPVRMVAIDEDWSALRFKRATQIKTMTRSFAMSAEGKKKVAVAKKITRKPAKKK